MSTELTTTKVQTNVVREQIYGASSRCPLPIAIVRTRYPVLSHIVTAAIAHETAQSNAKGLWPAQAVTRGLKQPGHDLTQPGHELMHFGNNEHSANNMSQAQKTAVLSMLWPTELLGQHAQELQTQTICSIGNNGCRWVSIGHHAPICYYTTISLIEICNKYHCHAVVEHINETHCLVIDTQTRTNTTHQR
jgi:hypothetical protein